MFRSLLSLLALVLGEAVLVFAQGGSNLRVTAPSGTYIGLINGTVPNVREFLGIPLAAAPVGSRRWLPPVKPNTTSSNVVPATDIKLACPQYGSRWPNVFNQVLYQNQPPFWGQSHTPGTMVWSSGEDCLSLSVWTPANATSTSKLPVIIFIPGGGFVNSGSWTSSWYRPHRYRLNIIGYPNARGLQEQNLGQMDQRMAIEWVRDNIEAFGGDPDHITLWGESAGAVATDFQNFAYPDAPIVTGFYMDSGSAITGQNFNIIRDHSGSNFTFVASHLGCGGLNASAELACMRDVPVWDIINFMGQDQDNQTDVAPHQAVLEFGPVADERYIFSNYTQRYAQGRYAQRPAIYSSCANEFAALLTYALGLPDIPATQYRLTPAQQTLANNFTMQYFLCPASESVQARDRDNLTTYRFLYGGNFTNVSPLPYLGPYHSSDLAMLFGSFQDFNGQGPPLQYETSALMQDLLLAFMKDPVNGPRRMGWPLASSGNILLFGADGRASQNVSAQRWDAACTGAAPYDAYP